MEYNIDEKSLKLLLEKRKDYINSKHKILDLVAWIVILIQSGISFFVEANIYFLAFEILIMIISVGVIIYICINIRSKYNHEKLFDEITDLHDSPHEYSLIAIKDTYNEYPNRFLLYYNTKWECRFFPNIKTSESNRENAIISKLSNELKLDKNNIEIKMRAEGTHPKYSSKYDLERDYRHKLYEVTIKHFNNIMKKDHFEIDGLHYWWMTTQEMENDKEIKKKNLDIVRFVKTNIQ